MDEQKTRIDLSELKEAVDDIRRICKSIIVGQEEMIDLLIVAILANGHVLLEGMPGTAKTLSAKILARSISADFSRIQFTPDLMPSDILGTSIFNMKEASFSFKAGPIFSNIILIDEINRSPAKTQAALFEVMEERQITIDGKKYKMDEPFLVLATQNPVEHEGTYRLPEAQLDRFLFKIKIDYPSLEEEKLILERIHQNEMKFDLDAITAILSKEKIASLQKTISSIHVEDHLFRYIAQLVHATRVNSSLYLAASSRASIAILTASKAFAAINGRDFITPDDVQFLTKAVLNHRILLNAEREMEGLREEDIIEELIKQVDVPR